MPTFVPMDGNILLTAKALHIIFVVSWFAALFYQPRIYIYIIEANSLPEAERSVVHKQLKLMAKRLWFIIGWPACVIAILSAVTMLIVYPAYLQMPWMHVKLALVMLLFVYHLSLHRMYLKIQKGNLRLSSTQLRFYNELATILLFAIVFTVVFKNTMSWLYGTLGILFLGILLSVAIVIYRRFRKKK